MKNDCYNGNMLSRRRFIAGAAAAGAALFVSRDVFSVMAPVPKGAKAEVPVLKAHADGTLCILAVTDLHFFADHNVDMDTVSDIRKIVEKYKPDIMIPTGDIWHNNPSGRGMEFCRFACEQLGGLGVPWAFVWGNHDTVDDYDAAHKLIGSAKNSLYRGGAADGNYRIEVRDASGQNPLWNLILLNDSRDGMTDEPLNWLKSEAAAISSSASLPPPAFLFFHIPFKQYEDLAKSRKVKGIMLDAMGKYSPYAFDVIKGLGFIKGTFCGHDHANNYWGEQDGVFLEYVRSTGRGGYGAEKCKKGATIIDLNVLSGEFKTKTVFPDGTVWSPKIFFGG